MRVQEIHILDFEDRELLVIGIVGRHGVDRNYHIESARYTADGGQHNRPIARAAGENCRRYALILQHLFQFGRVEFVALHLDHGFARNRRERAHFVAGLHGRRNHVHDEQMFRTGVGK